jgi:acetyl-CoA acetyltransferase
MWVSSTSKNADDIVITAAIRTPLAKAKKGGFKDTSLDYMVFALLKKLLEKSAIDPNLIEDVCMGNVRPFLSDPSSATSGT